MRSRRDPRTGRIAALDTPAGLVDSVGGEYRMRFRPTAPLDERSLAALPGVTRSPATEHRSTVTGTGDFARRSPRNWPAGRSSSRTCGSRDAAWTAPTSR